jgi:ABC-type uncharacterized transport system auxiliary subunit
MSKKKITVFSFVIAAFLSFVLIASCSLTSRPYPMVRTFSLELPLPDGQSANIGTKKPTFTFLVTATPPPAAYETKKLIYKLSATEFTQDFYSEFYTPPTRAIADSIARYLDFTSQNYYFVRSQGVKLPDFALEIQLMDFHGDLSQGDLKAQITLSITLNDLRPSNPRLIFTRNYVKSIKADVTSEENRNEALVQAFIVGLNEIVTELYVDIRSSINASRR